MPTSADLLLDTSAAVALVTPTAESHEAILARTHGATLGLAGHAAFETYSVLTRLPGGLRVSAAGAQRIIETNFPATVHLEPAAAAAAVAALAGAGIAGGAVYDGLVALAAASVDTALLSCDRRAAPTYAALAVRFELI
ncbi:PIN domain-containing protein [Microbacterium cremeum]|uniref:PIN domain-containing protein n=1 Tax=Microbacterium cremeum TaxID=2782169 RepID=UPI0018875193|nr:PIN domain-containing protein [Microbacterium cremeum]